MRKSTILWIAVVALLSVLLVSNAMAQTAVTKWGSTPRGANSWTILNTASTPAGNASMGGTAAPSGYMSIKGGFDSLQATTSQAFVITGTFEFVGGGGGSAYTWLRYALFNEAGTLNNQNTPTAAWTEDGNAYGYTFTPVSGAGTISNTFNSWPTGNQGTNWPLINSKSWTSTNSNGGGPYATILQAPYHQAAAAGVYDWAMSVQPLSNGYNEVRWYFVQQHTTGANNYYWWGGSYIDSARVAATKFNSVGFAINSDVDATLKQINLTNVKVSLGSPITVPVAPFQSFYVDAWGTTPRGYTYASGWKMLNDTTYLVGDAGMAGTKAPTGYASIKGGFREAVTPTTSKALIITGTFEFVGGGGGSAYTWLRYALFQGDGALTNQNKDSAAWSETSNGNGYIFTPVTGGGTISNTFNTWPSGNQGTNWPLVNSKSWTSTNSNGGGPFATVLQVPHNQVAAAGVYDWAISVQPLAAGGNEVRWYFIQQHAAGSNNYYWWGGSYIDATPGTAKYNSIGFAINSDIDATCKQINIRNVKVDLGSPITVPTPPWIAYYIDKWGIIGGRMYGWNYVPDAAGLIGNAGIGGTAPNGKWAAIRGGFDPVTPTTAKALLLTGKVVFVGGGVTNPASLRFGMFYSDQAGKVILDSAKATLPDSTRWDGLETYTSGYLFIPPTGTSGLASWTGLNTTASSGGVVNGAWLQNDYPAAGPALMTSNYSLGKDVQTPANAVITAGTYNFTMSVAATASGGNDVRWKLAKSDNSYSITGKLIDTQTPLATTKFNSVNFAVGNNPTTGINLTDVKVDYVDVATLPLIAPQGAATGVEQNDGVVPAEFGLAQNYPNPFNPSTTISYDVAKAAHVTIRVYDVLGRMVAQLVDGLQNPSRYTVQWNPAGLSSGTYIYKLDARNADGSGNFSSVKKLLYMK